MLGYIDNSFVASLDPQMTARARAAIDDAFRCKGLRVHEVMEAPAWESFWGMEIDGRQGLLKPSQKRVWILCQAVTSLHENPSCRRAISRLFVDISFFCGASTANGCRFLLLVTSSSTRHFALQQFCGHRG